MKKLKTSIKLSMTTISFPDSKPFILFCLFLLDIGIENAKN